MINLPGTRVQKESDVSSPDLPCHSTEETRKGWKPWVWSVFSLDMRVGSSFIWTGAKRSRETHVEEGFSMAARSFGPDDSLLWKASRCTASCAPLMPAAPQLKCDSSKSPRGKCAITVCQSNNAKTLLVVSRCRIKPREPRSEGMLIWQLARLSKGPLLFELPLSVLCQSHGHQTPVRAQ